MKWWGWLILAIVGIFVIRAIVKIITHRDEWASESGGLDKLKAMIKCCIE